MRGERIQGARYRLAGILLLIAATVVAGIGLPGQFHLLHQREQSARSIKTVGGIPVVGGVQASAPQFLLEVRKIVPERARFRILIGAGRSCLSNPLFWFEYQLLPRAAVCDASARWWLLYRTGPIPLPAGARVVAGDGHYFQLIELSRS